MLSRQNRLSLKTDRFRLEKEGQTQSSSIFTVVIGQREKNALPTRFAILVSKKLLPLSSDRHKLKRRLTEIVRLNLSELPTGLDIFLIPKRSLLAAFKEQILSDLKKLCF